MNPPTQTEVSRYLSEIGKRGGKKNSPAQRAHRRTKAIRAMLHKRFPHDKRWMPEKDEKD
jgi:hypothetical protein